MNPIATIIQNNTPHGHFANWTGATKTWLPGNGVAEVPFEVWSVCDKKQRDALIADLKYGTVSLSVRILKPNGNFETIPYNPIANIAPQAPVQKAAPQQSPTDSKTEQTATSNKHIVIAGDKEMNDVAKHFHLKSETVVQPGIAEVGADIQDTVEFKNGVLNEEEKQEETPVEPADLIEKTAAEEPVEETPEVSFEDQINELLSAKDYEEAHKLLVDHYGKDKITFKATALKNTKTLAAIVKKYKLDE